MRNRVSNRDRFEIMSDVIETCLQEAKLTRVMYRSRLTYDQVRTYIDGLLRSELIEKVMIDGKPHYRATPRGRELHLLTKEVEQLLGAESVSPTYKRYSAMPYSEAV